MLDLRIHTNRLLLPASTKASMDLVPPLRMDGIEDNFTIPFTVPVRGNEAALGHVHHLPLAERQLVLRHARLGYAAQHVTSGVLRVMGSNERAVKLSFSAQGLVDRLKGVRLRDALQGHQINTLPEGGLAAHAKAVTMVAQPNESHCFPMHANPALYGSENPDWSSGASQWDVTRLYSINDRVYVEETSPAARKWEYQCIAASIGEKPGDYPDKWRRIVFGLVNSFNLEDQAYDVNEPGGNFYAMVPWFRYDWLVRRAVEGIGLMAKGDWFSRPETPYMLLANSTPLDGPQPTGAFSARQTGADAIYTAPDTEVPIPANDDNTAPWTDPSDLWDNSSFEFTPDAAGVWNFTAHVEAEFSSADRLAIYVSRPSGGQYAMYYNPETARPYGAVHQVSGTVHDVTLEFTVPFSLDDVGTPFQLRVCPVYQSQFMAQVTLRNCWVTGSRYGGTALNSYRDIINPADHVPDMELGEFLQAVADCFGLEVVPDLDHDTIEFNSREQAIREYTHAEDQTRRLAGPLELDHTRNVPGLRFSWPVDGVEAEDLVGSTLAAVVDREHDLPGDVLNNTHAIVRSTRKLFQADARHTDSGVTVVWKHVGFSIPQALAGDTEDATDMPVRIKPVMMDELWLDGRKLLMPSMDQAGESAFYATGPKDAELHLAVNGLRQLAAEDGTPYPGATAWGLDNLGNECESLLLTEQRDAPTMPSFWGRHHRAWADTLVRSEPVTTDLQIDLPFLRGRAWHRIMPMQGQLYIVDKMSVTMGHGSSEDMISKGAYLRRLRPSVNPWPVRPVSNATQRRCVYWVDILPHFMADIADACTIKSFLVDGVEHAPGGGIDLTLPDNYVTVGGEDYYTNLIDSLTAMGVAGFTFWPHERIPIPPLNGNPVPPHGQWMSITYPVNVPWRIELEIVGLRYRYWSGGVSYWNGSAWVAPFNYMGVSAPFVRLCEDL